MQLKRDSTKEISGDGMLLYLAGSGGYRVS